MNTMEKLTRTFRCEGLIAAALCLLTATLNAQTTSTGVVMGRVLNATSGNYLNNARVVVKDTLLEANTNENGEYRLVGVAAGTVTVLVSYTGMAPQIKSVQVAAGRSARLDFDLVLFGTEKEASGIIKLEAFTVEERQVSAQAAALHEQRNAANIKNVVSFDEFADLGEGNVGEYLKYIPGVNVGYGALAETVSIRGMPASGTLIMVDGIEIVTSNVSTRDFHLTGVNTANIERIEVTKVPTPDLPANAVGGSVNLIEKSGFVSGRPQLRYNLLLTETTTEPLLTLNTRMRKRPGSDPKSSVAPVQPGIDLTYLFPVNKSLALVLAAGHNARLSEREYLSTTWDRVNLVQTSNILNSIIEHRLRDNASVGADWRINERNTLRLSLQYESDDALTRQHQFQPTFGTFAAGLTGGENFSQGAASGVGSVAQNNATWYDQYKSTVYGQLKYRYNSDVWKVDISAGRSQSIRTTKDLEDGFFERSSSSILNLVVRADGLGNIQSAGMPRITAVDRQGRRVDVFDGNLYTLNTVTSSPAWTKNANDTLMLNVGRSLGLAVPASIKAGVSFSRTARDLRTDSRNWNVRPPDSAGGRLAGNYDLIASDFSARRIYRYDLSMKWISNYKLSQLYQSHPEYFQLDEPTALISKVNASKKLEETISAAYLRGDLKLMNNRLWIVGGARLENTEDEGWGPLNDVSALYVKDASGKLVRDASGNLTRVTSDPLTAARLQYKERAAHSKKSNQGYYPSINSSYAFTENVLLRGAYARTIGRPELSFIIPGVTVADPSASLNARTITVVNSGLQPWTADNFDLSLEAYDLKGAAVSVSVFRKNLAKFFTSVRSHADTTFLAQNGLSNDYLEYDVETMVNSPLKASITGFEWSWRQSLQPVVGLPAWARGLQFFFNTTLVDFGGPGAAVNLTGFSAQPPPRVINWGVSYLRPKLSLNVNVNQVKSVRLSLLSPNATTPVGTYDYLPPRTVVAASFEYRFYKRLAVYGSVRNLTRSLTKRISKAPNTPAWAQPVQFRDFGAQVTAGIKGEF